MNRCRKGSGLITFIIVMVVIIIILSFLTIAPVIRNIVPFIIGVGVGYFFGRNKD